MATREARSQYNQSKDEARKALDIRKLESKDREPVWLQGGGGGVRFRAADSMRLVTWLDDITEATPQRNVRAWSWKVRYNHSREELIVTLRFEDATTNLIDKQRQTSYFPKWRFMTLISSSVPALEMCTITQQHKGSTIKLICLNGSLIELIRAIVRMSCPVPEILAKVVEVSAAEDYLLEM